MSAVADATAAGSSSRTSPFVGLEPYREGDAAFFFGREREQRIIIANLRSSRLTLLYGASGVGKSSVLRAGVVHELRQRIATDAAAPRRRRGAGPSPATHAVAYFSAWRDDRPLERIMEGIRTAAREALGGDDLPQWSPGVSVVDALGAWTGRVRAILVVLDQFEEHFLYHGHEEGPGSFAAEFPGVINEPGLHVNFLISLREDAWAKLDRFKASIPNLFTNYLRLDYLDRDGAHRAIQRSIDAYNDVQALTDTPSAFKIEPALTEAVLNGVQTGAAAIADTPEAAAQTDRSTADQRVETPFLQLVMQRIWDAVVERDSTTLDLATLDELGGPQEIVRRHLERAMSELKDADKAIAAEAFRFLVTSSKTKIAQQASDLGDWSGAPEKRVIEVLEQLAGGHSGRILRPLPPLPGSLSPRYEIFHDVLAEPIIEWRKRYEQERETTALAEELEEEDRRRLEVERARHAEQIKRVALWSFGVLFLMAVAFGVTVWFIQQHARSAEKSQRLAASALAQLPVDPERAILLAREAMDEQRTPEAQTAMREALGASHVRARVPSRAPTPALRGALSSAGGRVIATRADREVRLWDGNGGEVGRAIAPGGKIVDVGLSADGSAAVVATRVGAVVERLGPSPAPARLPTSGSLTSTAASSDGRYVATASTTGVTIWRVRDRHEMRTLDVDGATSVRFDPHDAGTVAIARCGRAAALVWAWGTNTSRRLAGAGIAGPSSGPTCLLSFSPDGRYLAAALGEPTVGVYTVATGQLLTELRDGDDRTTSPTLAQLRPPDAALAWRHDSRWIAVVSGKNVLLWPVKRRSYSPFGDVLQRDSMTAAAFNSDGSLLATGSQDGSAQVWDLRSAQVLTELKGHTDSITSIAFLGRGRVVTTSLDGTARVWDLATGRTLEQNGSVVGGAYSPRGERVATVALGGQAYIWWPARHRRARIAPQEAVDTPATVEFDRSGKRLLIVGSTGNRGRVVLADATTGALQQTFDFPTRGPVRKSDLSPDGRRLIVSDQGGGASLLDLAGKRIGAPLAGGGATDAEFSDDGRLIVTAGMDGRARIFDASTGSLRRTIGRPGSRLTGASFSPDGSRIITYGFDRTARVWATEDGRLVAPLSGHTGWISTAAFAPDGRHVVTAGIDQSIRIWDVQERKLLAVEHPLSSVINSVAVSPDGRWILSTSDDGRATITSAVGARSADELLKMAATRVTRDLTASERADFLSG